MYKFSKVDIFFKIKNFTHLISCNSHLTPAKILRIRTISEIIIMKTSCLIECLLKTLYSYYLTFNQLLYFEVAPSEKTKKKQSLLIKEPKSHDVFRFFFKLWHSLPVMLIIVNYISPYILIIPYHLITDTCPLTQVLMT